jgi:hypothetical protein
MISLREPTEHLIYLLYLHPINWDGMSKAGWDFYRHPGILDDTKSVYLTKNIKWNYRTLSQKFNIPSIEILYVPGRKFLSQKETSCHRK